MASSSSTSSSSSSSFSDNNSSSCRHFSLDDIKKATNNFDEKKVLGFGGEGKVYLAKIYVKRKTQRSKVAIKRLNKDSTEFEKEIRIVSKIKHPNLVSLLGYCNEANEKILIYEYMEKGSLSRYLKMSSNVCLSWKQRLKICLDAAYGLQHLHKETVECSKGIIHRDVKPDNILLDQNWVAKVSDFGMFKLSTPVQIHSTIITGIKGTRGYFAPEYIMSNHITRKIDVYSFGLVMFEVLCQKKPWDRGDDQSVYLDGTEDLGAWAQKNVYSEIKANMANDSVKVFADVIGRSLQFDPKRRPTMDDIVLALKTALQCQEHHDEQTLKARSLPQNADQVFSRKHWRLLQCQNGLRIFEELREVDFLPKSCSKAMKATGVVEATCEEIFELVMSMGTTRFEWDSSFQDGSLVEKVDGHTDILYHRLQLDWFPIFVWPRDLCYVRYWQRNDDGSYVVSFCSRDHENCGPKPGFVRAHIESGGYKIAPLKPRNGRPRTMVQHLMHIDLKGWGVGYMSSFQQHCLLQMLNSLSGLREYVEAAYISHQFEEIPVMVNMASASVPKNSMMDEYSDEDEDFRIAMKRHLQTLTRR